MACKLLCQRPIKKKQLFIYGPPSKQQTSIFHFLQKYSGYTMPAPERTTSLGHIIIRISGSLTNSTKQADRAGLSHSQKKERHTPNTLLKALYGQECRLDSKYSIVFTTKANVPIDSQSSTQKSKWIRALQGAIYHTQIQTKIKKERSDLATEPALEEEKFLLGSFLLLFQPKIPRKWHIIR